MAAWVGVGKVSVLSPEEIAAEITAQDSAPTGQTVETGSEMAKVVRQRDFEPCNSYRSLIQEGLKHQIQLLMTDELISMTVFEANKSKQEREF